ncbi:hypothetical protein CP10743SC13_0426 [Chlamydia psittaci 10_743_SC13]|nr:hypothetical protein CP10743SC13_0426 [Chlamydia psittaci 10_743_SC13]
MSSSLKSKAESLASVTISSLSKYVRFIAYPLCCSMKNHSFTMD